jgi:hypothetical protein
VRAFLPLFILTALLSSRSEAAQTAQSELFDPIASVVTHPRCLNCHQGDSPRQTDAAIQHQPPVVRGRDGRGDPTLPCRTCHQATNTGDGSVPGAPDWRLAPLSMKWQGLTKRQICQEMKDPARNGHRTGKDVIEHMKLDPLVLWAWTPGAGRATPPIPHEQFVKALETWVSAGMPCKTGG